MCSQPCKSNDHVINQEVNVQKRGGELRLLFCPIDSEDNLFHGTYLEIYT